MKTFVLSMLLCLFFLPLLAQRVALMDAAALNKRLEAGKDTLFIVNLWATWCVPCVAEIPHFQQLRSQYADPQLKILFVSLDFKSKIESEVKPFLKKHSLPGEVFVMSDPDQQHFIEQLDPNWSGTIPATLVVNTKKKRRQFVQEELTYEQLENLYRLNK